jgi:hypothetical protein
MVRSRGNAREEPVVPPSPPDRPTRWLGALKTSGRIKGDVVGPAGEAKDWDALSLHRST